MPITINFKNMTIENKEKTIEEFYAIEAVDTAKLKYFILQPDVALIEHDGSAKVQAKLKSLEDEDINSNGKGVTQTSLILYNVSESKQKDANKTNKSKPGKNKEKKSGIVREPKDRKMVEFYLNQSFLRTQEKIDSQLWKVNPSCINKKKQYFGSVIYEEVGSDELCLNFVTGIVKEVTKHNHNNNEDADEQEELHYPQ